MKTANKKKTLMLTKERKLELDMLKRFKCSCYYNELKQATRFKDSCIVNLICKLMEKNQ